MIRVDYDLELIKSEMARRFWTVGKLAVKARLSPSRVSRFLAGKHRNPETARAISKALGISSELVVKAS